VNEGRQLRILHIGSKRVGVFEDDVFTTAPWRDPTPLPFAPDAVRGVVAVAGRMFTVLDIANHLGVGPTGPRAQIVALRGPEQFALAVDDSDLGEGDAELLDLNALFSTVMKGQERRRRNF
jgi:chemotaxis signal transduction protein